MNRRELLGTGVSIGAFASALRACHPAPAFAGTLNPDAELIAACEAYPALCAAYEAEDGEVDEGPAYEAWFPANKIICEARPQTLPGMLALARTAVTNLDQWGGGGEFFHSDAEAWGFTVVRTLVRLADAGRIGLAG